MAKLPKHLEALYNSRIAGVVASPNNDEERLGLLLKKDGKQYVMWIAGDDEFLTPGHVAIAEL